MISRLYKTENIIKVTPEETLSHVMSYFTSSHDAAFVFDPSAGSQQGEFLGVVSPYYSIIKKSYPANTKVKHCLIHPPKVDINTKIDKVARLMMDSKIHYLPVFDSGASNKFAGIISARRILTGIKDSEKLDKKIGDFLGKRRPIISIFENEFISKAMPLFKQNRISKLVVLTEDFKLRGILSYYDLISFLAVPKERAGFSRTGGTTPILHTKVKNFMKTNVLTLTRQNTLAEAAELILKKQIGSIIAVDGQHHPVGIITTRDILQAYVGVPQFMQIDVVTKDLSKKSIGLVNSFMRQINQRFIKRPQFDKARIVIKEGGQGGVFEAVLSLFRLGGQPKVIKEEGKDLKKVLRDVSQKSKRAVSKK